MNEAMNTIIQRAVDPRTLRANGPLTSPRTWGVYEVARPGGTRPVRFGNHPVRLHELEAEFGKVRMLHLFRNRGDAMRVAALLNAGGV